MEGKPLNLKSCLVIAVLFAYMAPPAFLAQTSDVVQNGSDIPAKWQKPKIDYDYLKRDEMVPMRDGVKLRTVILVPKGAHDLPMLFERTPYNVEIFIHNDNPHLRDILGLASREWADDSYILVFQDIRGKYGSEGAYVMTRPPMGSLNPSETDDTTDAWDTIDWLLKNVPESNKRVGMIGSSYDGWTVTMALLNPHPALKVAAPESPMIDGWMGDDWFHYGAFRQVNLDYFIEQTSKTGSGASVPRWSSDDYQNFLDAGTAGNWASKNGIEQLPFWSRLSAHPVAIPLAFRASHAWTAPYMSSWSHKPCSHTVGMEARWAASILSSAWPSQKAEQPPCCGSLVSRPVQPRG
jgi:uncharacterized protein